MSHCCAPQLGHLCGCSSARSVSLHYSIHCISPEYKTYLPVALHLWQDPALCQASVISTCSSACHSVLALSTGGSWLIDFWFASFQRLLSQVFWFLARLTNTEITVTLGYQCSDSQRKAFWPLISFANAGIIVTLFLYWSILPLVQIHKCRITFTLKDIKSYLIWKMQGNEKK